ncbi:MAG: hypothetical protein V8Q27_08245 [Eubacteriales bacterium]
MPWSPDGGRQERSLTLERGVLEREMEFRLYQPGYRFREEVAIYVADQKGEKRRNIIWRALISDGLA